MLVTALAGATSLIVEFPIFNSSSTTGALLTGVTYNSSGITAYYDIAGASGSATSFGLATMTKGAWATGGFVAVDATNMPGVYQIGVPNACIANAGSCTIFIQGVTNMVPVIITIQILAANVAANVAQWLGTAVTAATSGIPDVNTKNIANSAVSTTSAQIGVNVVNIAGTANKGAGGYVGIDWSQINAPTTSQNLSGTTISTVSGNVSGSVGSIASGGITSGSFAASAGIGPIRANTAQAVAAGSITLDASASSTNSYYNGMLVVITGGTTGVGQVRLITGYVGSTQVASVTPNWTTTPTGTVTFAILPFGQADVETFKLNAVVLDANNLPEVDIQDISGAAVATGSAQLGVNVVNIGTHAVTLDGNNLLEVDIQDIAGSAVSTSSAQIGVNVVSHSSGAINNASLNSDIQSTAYASNTLQQMIYKLFDLATGNMTSLTTYSGYAFTAGGFWDVFAKTAWTMRGEMTIGDSSGNVQTYDLSGATWKSFSAALTDSSGTTTRSLIN